MKIVTSFDHPPIPNRNCDWSAIDADTFDADYDYEAGHYVSKRPVGRGPTELDAIFDLLEQIMEKVLDTV